jgi:hypothetical protein|tara:strand:+ start:193 stop:378 length:186 start_codon:yes stop_codon:yes gene_type:complete
MEDYSMQCLDIAQTECEAQGLLIGYVPFEFLESVFAQLNENNIPGCANMIVEEARRLNGNL